MGKPRFKDLIFFHPELSKKEGYFLNEKSVGRDDTEVFFRRYRIADVIDEKRLPSKNDAIMRWQITQILELSKSKESVTVPRENFQELPGLAILYRHPDMDELSIDPDMIAQGRMIGWNKMVEINTVLKRALGIHDRRYHEFKGELSHFRAEKKKTDVELGCMRDKYEETLGELSNVKQQATDLTTRTEYYRTQITAMLDQEIDGRKMVVRTAELLGSFEKMVGALSDRVELTERRMAGTADYEVLNEKSEELENRIESISSEIEEHESQLKEILKPKPKKQKKEEEKAEEETKKEEESGSKKSIFRERRD